MKRDQPDATEFEPHVFDQTNGLVDRGPGESDQSRADRDLARRQTVGGIAMLSTTRP